MKIFAGALITLALIGCSNNSESSVKDSNDQGHSNYFFSVDRRSRGGSIQEIFIQVNELGSYDALTRRTGVGEDPNHAKTILGTFAPNHCHESLDAQGALTAVVCEFDDRAKLGLLNNVSIFKEGDTFKATNHIAADDSFHGHVDKTELIADGLTGGRVSTP